MKPARSLAADAHFVADTSANRTFSCVRDQVGTGLGLAICKGLLKLMGGKISAESEPGIGSKFSVLVPLFLAERRLGASPRMVEVGKAPLDDATTNVKGSSSSRPEDVSIALAPIPEDLKLTVLVAEDNKVNQLLIRKILRYYGHQVELVDNGKLALEAVQRAQYDMVLMDLQMPILVSETTLSFQ